MMKAPTALAALRARFDRDWSDFVCGWYPDEVSAEGRLFQANSYVLQGAGKRVRPLLTLASCEALGGPVDAAILPAIAVELVHSYSLVHDDLPCMDDDVLRRGRPTAHVRFGEDIAVLAGDSLLTDAFALLAQSDDSAAASLSSIRAYLGLDTSIRLRLVDVLADCAGSRGMALGQVLDLQNTGSIRADLEGLVRMHRLKTGRLMEAASVMGALCAGASPSLCRELRSIAGDIGLCFQIIDDCLDETGRSGKSPGKDLRQAKTTFVSLMGPEEARAYAADLQSSIVKRLQSPRFSKSDSLLNLSEQLLRRSH